MICPSYDSDEISPCICFISKKPVWYASTCEYENKTVTELNMEANYKKELSE